jgi:rubrerythrin
VGERRVVMGSGEDILIKKDRTSSTYDILLKKAVKEGRVGGKFRCPVCGMRFKMEKEASACCAKVYLKA